MVNLPCLFIYVEMYEILRYNSFKSLKKTSTKMNYYRDNTVGESVDNCFRKLLWRVI